MTTVVIAQSLPRYCPICHGDEHVTLRPGGSPVPCPHCTNPRPLHTLLNAQGGAQ